MSDFPIEKAKRGSEAALRRQAAMRRNGEKIKGRPLAYLKPIDQHAERRPKFDDAPLKLLGDLW